MSETYDILHQAEENLFYIALEEGQRAFIKYRLMSTSSEVDFYSTFVPDDYRGKGLASKLVKHAFKWAQEQSLGIKSSCWYAEKLRQRMFDK